MSTLLSKSTFIRSLQCQKSLYLHKNFYQLKDAISQERQYVFERGHNVGRLAQQLFQGGIDVGWESPKEYQLSANKTIQCMSEGMDVIYEASFVWNDVLVAADIIVKEGDGWHIYEVKSSLGISETYLRDAALQLYVISKSGLHISGISIVHLDKGYVRQNELELDKLFHIEDVTSRVEERMNDIILGLIEARTTLSKNHIPAIDIGPQCDAPYTCDFKGYCGWDKMPPDSIFNLEDLEEEQIWTLFQKNILFVRDIPQDYPLTEIQKISIKSKISSEVYIDRKAIGVHLNKIRFPASFIDIQVFRPPVPLTFGSHPYRQIPFGYALKDSEIEEIEIYLSDPGFDFEEAFIAKFLADTKEYKTLITFDKHWQVKAIQKISERYPQYKSEIEKRLESIVDLSDIFKSRHFYHPKMKENLRDLPAVFELGIKTNKDDKIASDSLAGTAFEHLYLNGDLMKAIEIKEMLRHYMRGNIEAMELVYKGLKLSIINNQ